MTTKEALTHEGLTEDQFDETWVVVLNTKGKYELSKKQARIVQEAMARGERGAIVFETFAISIPYIAEFYRERRFIKDQLAIAGRATEEVYKPVSEEKWAEFKKKAYKAINKNG